MSDDIRSFLSGPFSDISSGNAVVNHPIFVPIAKFPMFTIQINMNVYYKIADIVINLIFLRKSAVNS